MSPVAKMKTLGLFRGNGTESSLQRTVTVSTKVVCAVKAFSRGWSSQTALPYRASLTQDSTEHLHGPQPKALWAWMAGATLPLVRSVQ